MTIASEITRIRAAKAALMTAINSKGGTLTASQLLGDYAPAVDAIQTGGGETSFYQCASVDTAAGTWTGYKWEWDDTEGKYILSSSLTSDPLTIEGFKPIIGETYSGNTRERADMWEGSTLGEGLVFYAPLASASETAETGQTLTTNGTVSYNTVDGVPCAYFNGSSYITTSDVNNLPYNGHPFTISCFLRFVENYDSYNHMFYYGNELGFRLSGNTLQLFMKDGMWDLMDFSSYKDKFNSLIVTYDGENCSFYLNGAYKKSESMDMSNRISNNGELGIGTLLRYAPGSGYIAGCRIYNRALSAFEITQLATEFTPTA